MELLTGAVCPVGVIPCFSAAGSVPATGFLKQSGINMDSKGFITVNKVCLKPCSLCQPAVSPHSFHLLDFLLDDADKC